MGEEVVIAKAGIPVAKLIPIRGERPKFQFGSAKGAFVVPEDFNAPLPKDLEDLLEMRILLDTHTFLWGNHRRIKNSTQSSFAHSCGRAVV